MSVVRPSESERKEIERIMEHDLPRNRPVKSDSQLKIICCQCRNGICRDREHQNRQYKVGWKFEYPKKRHIKEWAKLEIALSERLFSVADWNDNQERSHIKNKDTTHPMVRRAIAVIRDEGGDAYLFSWAHLYGNSRNTPRIIYPRKKQWIEPNETADVNNSW